MSDVKKLSLNSEKFSLQKAIKFPSPPLNLTHFLDNEIYGGFSRKQLSLVLKPLELIVNVM
jgi:hypothetical protein